MDAFGLDDFYISGFMQCYILEIVFGLIFLRLDKIH